MALPYESMTDTATLIRNLSNGNRDASERAFDEIAAVAALEALQTRNADLKAQLAANGEPVARVDTGDNGWFADIFPGSDVEVGQALYATPQAAPALDVGLEAAIEYWRKKAIKLAEQLSEQAAPVRQLTDALHAADSFIGLTPHGDNCFVSAHYEGDPGNRCNCGKESVLETIDNAILAAAGEQSADAKDAERVEEMKEKRNRRLWGNSVNYEGWCYQVGQEEAKRLLAAALKDQEQEIAEENAVLNAAIAAQEKP